MHTSGASAQSSASHLLTFLVAQLQFLREWKLLDRRLYEVFKRILLIWGNPKERNCRQINVVSVGAKGHAFFLCHTILYPSLVWLNWFKWLLKWYGGLLLLLLLLLILLLLLLINCTRGIYIYLKQTMFLRYIVLQLFCCHNLWFR